MRSSSERSRGTNHRAAHGCLRDRTRATVCTQTASARVARARGRFDCSAAGTRRFIEQDAQQHLAMLRILYGACSAALDAFRAADNPVDEQLVLDLEMMVSRTKREIARLSEGPHRRAV